jgi:DeoR/GlpR family transcriptional regulator of sugar metabolism
VLDDKPMLAKQRQEWILARLREDGAVRVAELTGRLQVSDMTIRRDLDVLARRGLVDKVHGGATLHDNPTSDEPGFERKSSRQLAEKAAIAEAAAALIRPGNAVALSAGTTTFALARLLIDIPDLTIVTNSRRIAETFDPERVDHQTVILTGGVRTPSDALVGPIAERSIASLHVDVLFIGCHGMDLAAGLTTPNLAESETNRQFMQAARKVVVVADHTKWGVVGLSSFGDLRDADVLVTDDALPAEAQATLADAVGQILLGEVTGGGVTGGETREATQDGAGIREATRDGAAIGPNDAAQDRAARA